jgi:hypothetical protein
MKLAVMPLCPKRISFSLAEYIGAQKCADDLLPVCPRFCQAGSFTQKMLKAALNRPELAFS